MSYSKKELYKVTNRLYKALRKNPEELIIKKINSVEGWYHKESKIIEIDYRKSLIPTLIHEYLHKWNPDQCETWIIQHESMIVNSLSTRQIKNILKALTIAL